LPPRQSFYSADALVTLFLVLLAALISMASEGGMGATISMAIVSPRVISMAADSTAVDFTGAAGIGRKRNRADDKSRESRSSTKHVQAHHIQPGG
jgi:hypothetical protein